MNVPFSRWRVAHLRGKDAAITMLDSAWLRRGLYLALLGALITACGGTRNRRGSQSRRAHAAPQWFVTPQKGDARYLYFLGSANAAADESSARELAVQKALYELSVYCGATLTTDFKSVEIERNGKLNQQVALTVDVAGEEVSIRQAATEKWTVGKGSDGRFDAYVRLRWPRSEYARVQAAQRAKAERALSLFLEAEKATARFALSDAERLVRETRTLLGPVRSQIPLNHPTYRNSGLVFDAAEALSERLDGMRSSMDKRVAVAVICHENGKPKPCASRWVGTIRGRVTRAGLEVASEAVSPATTAAILDSRNPDPDPTVRNSKYVLAVKYDARLSGTESGFVFARCGARAVVFGTEKKRILKVTEVKPKKGGHVHFEGAMKKGCAQAEAELTAWIDQNMDALRGSAR